MKRKPVLPGTWPMWVGAALSLLLLWGIWWQMALSPKPPLSKRWVQHITVLPPPPVPPPLPVPAKPEIPSASVEEALPEPEPLPEKSEVEPAADLGLDAEGKTGSDAFGLAGRMGGRPLLGGGHAMLWYAAQLKDRLEQQLAELLKGTDARLRGYSVVLSVWLDVDGRLSRSELSDGSGTLAVDQAIRGALPKLQLSWIKPPPADMPQPIRIQIISRL